MTPWGPTGYPRSIFVIDGLVVLLLLGGIRLTRRIAGEWWGGPGRGERVFVYGAGDAGDMIVREMRHNQVFGLRAIGFIDDDLRKVGRRIHGVRVLGTREDSAQSVSRLRPTMVLIAIPEASPELVRAIARTLEPFRIPIKTLPRLRDLIDGVVRVDQIVRCQSKICSRVRRLGLSDAPLKSLLEGRRVLVTGAGGSIGSELCRQILRFRPAGLILFER
jgi:FlaA1/EpsC-like NDP-sugar epimerase